MNFFKTCDGEYIISICTGYGNTEITESEYNTILSAIRNCPRAEGKGYNLRTDLTWEEYDLPPVVLSDDDELSTEEAMGVLLGGMV